MRKSFETQDTEFLPQLVQCVDLENTFLHELLPPNDTDISTKKEKPTGLNLIIDLCHLNMDQYHLFKILETTGFYWICFIIFENSYYSL